MDRRLQGADTGQYSPAEMFAQAEKYALSKTSKSSGTTLSLAMMAGVFIGLAFIFYITVTTGSVGNSWGLNRLAGGIAFSLGLILVVICGGELFTSSMLSAIARANKQISTRTLLFSWGKVYVGNFIGALFLLLLVTGAGLYQLDHGQWGLNALKIAQHKIHSQPIQAFTLGILCNLLVCLAVWMTFCSAQMLTKALMLILPVAMFVSTGFEHCVANMFMVPLGITIQNMAGPEFWLQLGVDPAQFADLTWSNFITANLIPVTLGNIVGGALLVGLPYWRIFRKPNLHSVPQHSQPSGNNVTAILSQLKAKETIIMNHKHTIESAMQHTHFRLTADIAIETAIDSLLDRNLSGAPVVDDEQRLLGFFSAHDVLVEMWNNDYMPEPGRKVAHVMSRDMKTVSPDDSLLQLAEYICVDKKALYPTTSMGIATSFSNQTLAERARSTVVGRPHSYPVVENDRLVGMISRQDVMAALRGIYGERVNVLAEEKTSEQEAVLETA